MITPLKEEDWFASEEEEKIYEILENLKSKDV